MSSAKRRGVTALGVAIVALGLTLATAATVSADENEDCLECHGEEGFERDEPGDIHVDGKRFGDSIHGDMSCSDCHEDAVLEDGEHPEDLKEIDCGSCHEAETRQFAESLHGKALARGDELAPRCFDCHTTHAVFPPTDPRSSTYQLSIPTTCSRCHREGTAVTTARKLSQHEVVEHYSESIHGEGLYKRGLTVTAVCSNCHGTHLILPHEDPRSQIHHDNVAKTCMQCHGNIETVHTKVIRGELWEKAPHQIPVCIECHQPHEVRRVTYEEVYLDQDCLRCHGPEAGPQPLAPGGAPVQAKKMDPELLKGSAHTNIPCIKCHASIIDAQHPPRGYKSDVDCTACHADQGAQYLEGIHGQLADRGSDKAPSCKECHGGHGVLPHTNPASPSHPTNVPTLCRRCHGEGGVAVRATTAGLVQRYTMSIHGEGLEGGLVVTAVCTSCHSAHRQLPAADPRSTVHPDQIAGTCSRCHAGVEERLADSVHDRAKTAQDGKRRPTCEDCHTAHAIARTGEEQFRQAILQQCGACHEDVTASYFDTYHGKVSQLGYGKTAKCSDCHGSHAILPPEDPASTLSRDNIAATCAQCHEGSHRRFAGYLTHATHHDPDKYPILFYTFWGMTLLLLGTLSFFGLHTILWLPRSIREALRSRRQRKESRETRWVQRFPRYHRVTHILVILSFMTLVLTGMTLKFAYTEWAQWVAAYVFGGFESAGTWHRFAAVVTFVYFAMHLWHVFRERRRQGKRWRDYLFGPESLVPNKRDAREFWATVRWFLGRGERPRYGRWTYWEKFDYLAVFWGVAVIGLSGLILWFPETFTHVLPGWAVNVATIIHSDEALLAAGFIFTIHFFNTHFRADKFPMDPVIFTGRVRLDEFQHERPREYEQLVEAGELDAHLTDAPAPTSVRLAHVFGLLALTVGLVLVGLIVYSMVFAYR